MSNYLNRRRRFARYFRAFSRARFGRSALRKARKLRKRR